MLLATIASSMDAFVERSPNNYEFRTDFPKPQLGDLHRTFKNLPHSCEVMVRVAASSVNPADRYNDGYRLPKTIGSDIAGTVEAVQKGCTSLKPGDRVWGDIGANANLTKGVKTKELGAYAQYALALESQLGVVPENINFMEAGVLPKVALTSYKALVWYGGAPWSGASVLILGGSGGTGTTGIQLALALGASNVTTTTSALNCAYVRGLGAHQCIDYHSANWWDSSVVPDGSVDVVYDTVGQAGTADRAAKKLVPGGFFVTIAGSLSSNPRKDIHQARFINSDTNLDSAPILEKLGELIKNDELRLRRVDQVFPLSEVATAFNVSAGGHVVGKLGISIGD